MIFNEVHYRPLSEGESSSFANSFGLAIGISDDHKVLIINPDSDVCHIMSVDEIRTERRIMLGAAKSGFLVSGVPVEGTNEPETDFFYVFAGKHRGRYVKESNSGDFVITTEADIL